MHRLHRAVRASGAVAIAAAAALATTTAPAAHASSAPYQFYTHSGQRMQASGWSAPVLPTSGKVTQGPSESLGWGWNVEFVGMGLYGKPNYRVRTLGVRYNSQNVETRTNVCLTTAGSSVGTAVDYGPCAEYSALSRQNWRLATDSATGKTVFTQSVSGYVIGVRGRSKAVGAQLELQQNKPGDAAQAFWKVQFTG